MLIYTFNTAHGVSKQIKIELLDKPWVKQWTSYLVKLHQRVPNLGFTLGHTNWFGMVHADTNQDMLAKILESFVFFDTYFPELEYKQYVELATELHENPRGMVQHHLNIFHRCFTTLASTWYSKANIPETTTREKVFYHMHVINEMVHKLEATTYKTAPRRLASAHNNFFAIYSDNINSAYYKNKDKSWDMHGHEYFDDSHVFDCLVDEYQYDVWLNDDILGKDMIKAWLDGDKLDNDDITGNMLVTPSLMLDVEHTFAEVMSNEDFIKEYKTLNKKLNRFPIGNVVNKSDIDWSVDLDSHKKTKVDPRVTKIELDGIVLWDNIC